MIPSPDGLRSEDDTQRNIFSQRGLEDLVEGFGCSACECNTQGWSAG
ncbi:hypothetical protein Q7O_001291 [Pectobacterium carotovorum subsp. carotovorum PCCS1]|nr:hypothetical protein [Pectobacterium carotovorum subsp. carotovorum PCCS1]